MNALPIFYIQIDMKKMVMETITFVYIAEERYLIFRLLFSCVDDRHLFKSSIEIIFI